MLTPYLPYPPSSGGQVRSYNLIKQLASKHEITLFSLIKDPSEKKFVKELQKYGKKIHVVCTEKTNPPLLAQELKYQADKFIELAEIINSIKQR